MQPFDGFIFAIGAGEVFQVSDDIRGDSRPGSVDVLEELFSEELGEETSAHVESLFTVVVSVVLVGSSSVGVQEPEGHIPYKGGFTRNMLICSVSGGIKK